MDDVRIQATQLDRPSAVPDPNRYAQLLLAVENNGHWEQWGWGITVTPNMNADELWAQVQRGIAYLGSQLNGA